MDAGQQPTCTSSLKLGPRATKSVSQLTSINTPSLQVWDTMLFSSKCTCF